jgi:hypothetical protein
MQRLLVCCILLFLANSADAKLVLCHPEARRYFDGAATSLLFDTGAPRRGRVDRIELY